MRSFSEYRFLAKIKEKQAALEMNNRQFAAHLGVTRQYWQATTNDRKRLGPTIANAALARFPDLHDHYLAWVHTYRHGRGAAKPKDARADDDAASARAASVASAGVTPASAMVLAEVR